MAALAQQLELDYTTRSRAPGALRKRWLHLQQRRGRVAPVTIPAKTTIAARIELFASAELDTDLPQRPRTRAECAGVPRPCPFVSCQFSNFLDVNDSGGIKLNKGLDPTEVDPLWSCALDAADRGPHSLEEVASALSLTREGARIIEQRALDKLRRVHLRVLSSLK